MQAYGLVPIRTAMRLRTFLPLLATAVAMPVPAVATAAGTYTDHLCALPSGAPAPATLTSTATAGGEAVNGCGQAGGVLRVGLAGSGPWAAATGGSARYAAPEDTTIAAFELHRRSSGIATAADGTGRHEFRIAGEGEIVERCVAHEGCAADVDGVVSRSGLAWRWLELKAGCTGSVGDECQGPAGVRLELVRARVTLADGAAPVVSGIRGSLPEPGAKRGAVSVSFDAADRGGGLYRLITLVDGAVTEVRGLDQGPGTCADADPTDADPYAFAARVPCPLALTGLTATIDTTRLADGPHRVQVLVEDAAGHRTPVLAGGDSGTEVVVRNAVQNGVGADERAQLTLRFVRTKSRALRGRSGERHVIRGRLTDARGRGIVGARVTLRHLVGTRVALLKTGVRTRADGAITLILPKGLWGDAKGRRRLQFSYQAFSPGPVTAVETLTLTVVRRDGRPQTRRPGRG